MHDHRHVTAAIRPLAIEDAEALRDLRVANRAFMTPFDPTRDDAFFSLETAREVAANPDGHRFAILDGGELAGVIALSNVSFGAFCSANLGYWIDERRNGRGLATAAVGALVDEAFTNLGLHRLEAGTLLDNVASQRVLEKNAFERIGLARRYLKIDGAWRDHMLFQRVSDS